MANEKNDIRKTEETGKKEEKRMKIILNKPVGMDGDDAPNIAKGFFNGKFPDMAYGMPMEVPESYGKHLVETGSATALE